MQWMTRLCGLRPMPGKETDGNPSLRYITLLRDGARLHGLPDRWIESLDAVLHAE